jgi:hypothetical protein
VIELRMVPGAAAAASLTQVKLIATRFPGEQELTVLVGERRLGLGPDWRYDGSPACMAALNEFGTAEFVGPLPDWPPAP